MHEAFTWTLLASIAGASVATGFITQILKDMIKIPTQILSYLVALIVLLLATFFTVGFDISSLTLCIFNALLASSTASNTVALANRVKK